MKSLLAVGSCCLVAVLAGCNSTEVLNDIAENQEKQNLEIREISKLVEKQNKDIAILRETVQKMVKTEEKEEKEDEETDSGNLNGKLVDAAVLLAKRGPQNSAYNAIQILGYIGGKGAEEALLDMLKDNSFGRRYSSNIVRALSSMRSKKLRGVVIDIIKDGNPNEIRNIVNSINNNFTSIFKKSDLPMFAKLLDELPSNNNNFYSRCNLIKAICGLDQDLGVKLICNELETASRNNQRQLLYITNQHNMRISLANWEKIIKTIGSEPDGQNRELFEIVCQAISRGSDYRMTDIILPWANFAITNSNFRNNYMNALRVIQDPKAAKTMIDMYNAGARNDYYMRSFPGIVKNNGKYQLVDDAAMKKLMARREKIIDRLNARDKRLAASKVKVEKEKK